MCRAEVFLPPRGDIILSFGTRLIRILAHAGRGATALVTAGALKETRGASLTNRRLHRGARDAASMRAFKPARSAPGPQHGDGRTEWSGILMNALAASSSLAPVLTARRGDRGELDLQAAMGLTNSAPDTGRISLI